MHHSPSFKKTRPSELHGFEDIRIFSSYHPHPTMPSALAASTSNRDGLRDLQANEFGNITRVRLLSVRGILPTAYAAAPPGAGILGQMRAEVRGQLLGLRDAIGRDGHPKYTIAQKRFINHVHNGVNATYTLMNALTVAALDIPEGP